MFGRPEEIYGVPYLPSDKTSKSSCSTLVGGLTLGTALTGGFRDMGSWVQGSRDIRV